MKRREFLQFGMVATAGAITAKAIQLPRAFAAETPGVKSKITKKDILREGQPATIANYCEKPEKQPNKFCPNWKEGHCDTCTFFNKDNSLTDFEGGKYARCQLLADPKKPQFVAAKAYCATYVKKS